jgi:phosphopantetheinyl transferase (holo-ACP synthase)
MSSADQLREAVAKMLMLAPGEIGPETSLISLATSLGGARLAVALKRAGLQLPGDRVPATFGELETLLAGGPVAGGNVRNVADSPRYSAPAPDSGVQAGLDVQDVGALPVAADYWDHDFYRKMFDKTEIAYAVGQTEPRAHLAGFWCAKEALRKCDSSFAGTSPAATAVAHEESGKPYLLLVTPAGRTRLPHALSISHSGLIAGAVVFTGRSPEQPRVEAVAVPPAVPSVPRHTGLLAVVLAALSLICALAALLRSFR